MECDGFSVSYCVVKVKWSWTSHTDAMLIKLNNTWASQAYDTKDSTPFVHVTWP